MSMFCNQCQETAKNEGCKIKGVCGKNENTANLQDLLIYSLQGLAVALDKSNLEINPATSDLIYKALFSTITNVSFDEDRVIELIKEVLALRDQIKQKINLVGDYEDVLIWEASNKIDLLNKSQKIGLSSYSTNEDLRSLKALLLYGIKGMSAYAHHALVLGEHNSEITYFLIKALIAINQDLSSDELVSLVLETGQVTVTTMALLDTANTKTYGHPELSKVNLGVRNNPAILISGHDLRDLEDLLKQTAGTGIDVYTHSEMLPAHYYPAFKKYDNLVGNYGNAWWEQSTEFEKFNGPIIMTTNCLTLVKDSYKDRIFTTGTVAYPRIEHIADRKNDQSKDFSKVISLAKKCPAPESLEEGEIVGGFAHNQVLELADKIVEAVKSGAIKRFIVMAGCDGRHKERQYFTDVAQNLPQDTIILTAGCAKYRYNKLNLGDIGGIPRVLDAGQCNDCYSLVVIALKLKEVFELDDINDLPISFDIAWYEQKAVAVLLALLHLGVKGIHLGPTLPSFLSAGVAKVLIENFDIKGINTPQIDITSMLLDK